MATNRKPLVAVIVGFALMYGGWRAGASSSWPGLLALAGSFSIVMGVGVVIAAMAFIWLYGLRPTNRD